MDEVLPLTIEVTIPDYRTAGEGKNEHTVKLSYGIGLTWRLVTLTNNNARFSYDFVVVYTYVEASPALLQNHFSMSTKKP